MATTDRDIDRTIDRARREARRLRANALVLGILWMGRSIALWRTERLDRLIRRLEGRRPPPKGFLK